MIEKKKTMFIHTNQPFITSFFNKKGTYFLQFSARRACEGKPIGRVRVKIFRGYPAYKFILNR